MNYQLIANILKNKWFIGEEHAMSYGPMISGILAGQEVIFQPNKPVDKDSEQVTHIYTSEEVSYFRASWRTRFESVPTGSVAVIRIEGPLMKKDQYCGPTGMETMGEVIRMADNSRNVSAIVLQIDSPGGTVDGTKDLAEIIASVKKPVISFVDGLAASAALWIASGGKEVWASQPLAEIGSIGVMLSFADMQPAYEKMGVKFHSITAPQSTEKNKDFQDLRAGKYEDYQNNVLAPIAQEFIDTIKARFPKAEDKHLKGRVFFARDVMGVFVDQIGTLDQAILRAKEMSDELTPNNLKNPNQNTTEMKKFSNINAVLQVESLEALDGVASLTEEQLQAMDDALAAGNQATAAMETLQKNHATITQQLSDANATIAERDAIIASLQEDAGEDPAPLGVRKPESFGNADIVTNARDLYDSVKEI